MSAMCPMPHDGDSRRRVTMLTAVMSLLLLGSGVLAWYLAARRRALKNQGVAVIKEIRTRGLAHYWGDTPFIRGFLVTDADGNELGWELRVRRPRESGYVGLHVTRLGGHGYQEDWAALADTSRVDYRGTSSKGGITRSLVTISLEDNIVTVRQGQKRTGPTGQATVPANYVLECILPLVIRQVAAGGKPALVKLLFDQYALRRRDRGSYGVHFNTVTLAPTSKNVVEMRSGKGDKAYHLDETGEITRIEHLKSGVTYTEVPLKQLLKRYPVAEQHLR